MKWAGFEALTQPPSRHAVCRSFGPVLRTDTVEHVQMLPCFERCCLLYCPPPVAPRPSQIPERITELNPPLRTEFPFQLNPLPELNPLNPLNSRIQS